jgi:hypothetical protein
MPSYSALKIETACSPETLTQDVTTKNNNVVIQITSLKMLRINHKTLTQSRFKPEETECQSSVILTQTRPETLLYMRMSKYQHDGFLQYKDPRCGTAT